MKATFDRLAPALAGSTPKDVLLAGLGAFFGIGLTGYFVASGVAGAHSPLIVAPIGASAVLVFAVPSSPLAQPWSVVGGNIISCLVALAVIQLVPNPFLATAIAVGGAIVLMSAFRCLHPPGGAVALLTSLAAHKAVPPGFLFAFLPVGANSLLLVMVGLIFHRFSGHSYPHVPAPPPQNPHGTADAPPSRRDSFLSSDLDAVLGDMRETFDIDRDDLEELLWRLEERALARAPDSPRCADVMSKDVVTIPYDATVAEAREMMLARRLRCLPAVNRLGVYIGMVEARHLIGDAALVAAVMTSAPVARPDAPALTFAPALSSGRAYEVVVVDPDYRILGLITQTDMLAAAMRALKTSD
ncbi:HPP family protein [Rhodoblastus acidophilus]|uniref:HPP family protein n=1 Tax=Candidatus Rhodoblastus alkanivorans TaxID=2954117 RepID=A0ABS9Z952_9HYPH|nr:HPP family protein [Candidatus Rhodoblastus alkanivorans]MCI4680561.1 HPP family protein [Candidatus Rhodoblastus alkanivorans]MCI4683976.1 HPP family protein [Candidatus Rhodoblastus alkanivorans]MDI4641295.1 HPP family protein [Rhodoblastus acidophilus]